MISFDEYLRRSAVTRELLDTPLDLSSGAWAHLELDLSTGRFAEHRNLLDDPRGNHLFAYALKNVLLEALDPKPLTYREDGGRLADYSAYLPKREAPEREAR